MRRPIAAWLCQSTGEVRARWSAFGPDGRFDSLRWGKPPKIVPMLGDERALVIPPPPAARAEPPSGPRPPADAKPVTPTPPPPHPRGRRPRDLAGTGGPGRSQGRRPARARQGRVRKAEPARAEHKAQAGKVDAA